MKIQHLAVIFIIIIMPISIVFAQYTQMQIDTVLQEKKYDTKLLNCTYDAIKAYQLNTVNNSTSDVTNSKVADIEASVNAFKSSLVTAFGYSGYDLSVMDEYLPAIVYTLYDGYYIYSPYQNTLTETTVYNDSTYEDNDKINGLKTYVYYSCRYKYGSTSDFVITYTLDNSITIQGIVNGNYVNKSGYLIDGITKSGTTYIYDGISFAKTNEEQLKEYVGENEYSYVKLNGTKYYLNGGEVFSIINGVKTTQATDTIDPYSYKMYKDQIEGNTAAYSYYKEAFEFTKWVRSNLNGLYSNNAVDSQGNMIDTDGDGLHDFGSYRIFNPSGTANVTGNTATYGYIQDTDSNFNQMRRAIIRYSIETNLRTAIASFTDYSTVSTDFAMPKISESDWELIENNVTTISFLQGLNINSKKYNGYAVVPNSLTKEYVSENAIYMETTDGQYHKPNDIDLINDYTVQKSSGRLNLDYERRYLTGDDLKDKYYFPRTNASNNNPMMGCYKSISGNSGTNYVSTDMYKYMRENLKLSNFSGAQQDKVRALKTEYYRALARERQSSFKIYNDEILDIIILYGGPDGLASHITYTGPSYEIIKKYDNYTVTSSIPSTTYTDLVTGQVLSVEFKGWTDNVKDQTTVKYASGAQITNLKNSITLYPVWNISQYAVKYDANLGAGETVTGMPSPAYAKASLVDNITIPDAMPIKSSALKEYVCLGWSKIPNSTIVEYTAGDQISYSMMGSFGTILYAVWGEYATINKFDWKTDASSSITGTFNIGSRSIYSYTSFDEGSNSIQITGNRRNAGKSAIWTDFSAKNYYYMQLTFDYNIAFGDSFDAAGVLLGVNENGNYLNSKAISFNYYTWSSTAGSKNGGFWNLKYKKGQNSTQLTASAAGTSLTDNRAVLIEGLTIPTSGTMEVTIRNKSNGKKKLTIKVGSTKYDYDDQEVGYSFGFFSTHYSHSCRQIGNFELKNISMKVGEN